jgi:prolipoprotein diacylglyceryltransferase
VSQFRAATISKALFPLKWNPVIPYVEVTKLRLGPVSVPVFLLLLVTAIAVASAIIIVRGHRQGMAYERTEELCLWAALCGYAGGHLFRFAYDPDRLIQLLHDPRHILSGGIASFGGFFGGIAGAYGFFWLRKIKPTSGSSFWTWQALRFLSPGCSDGSAVRWSMTILA